MSTALDFREKKEGQSIPCLWPTHQPGTRRAGKHRLAIAGHPVTTAHGDPVYLCDECKASFLKIYNDTLRNAPCQTQREAVGAL